MCYCPGDEELHEDEHPWERGFEVGRGREQLSGLDWECVKTGGLYVITYNQLEHLPLRIGEGDANDLRSVKIYNYRLMLT